LWREQVGLEQRLPAEHPVPVAADGVDLAVVRDQPERLGQRPGREGVGGEPAVHQGDRGGEPLVGQVREEAGQLGGGEHPLVDQGAGGQRREVQLVPGLGGPPLGDLAQGVRPPVQLESFDAGFSGGFDAGFNAGFGGVFDLPIFRDGGVSIVSQSGGLGYPLTHILGRADIGLRYIVSTGNENDLGALDILEHYVADPGTRIIATYLEGVDDLARLERVARSADAAGKPLIVWKVGRSERGARAAAAHTGSVVGDDAEYRAIFARTNVISVGEVADLVDFIKVLDAPAQPQGQRIGMLTVSGGAGILFADACEDAGLMLPDLEQATAEHLRQLAPPFASLLNPVDVTAQVFNRPELLADCLAHICADPNIDSVVVFVASMMGPMAMGMAQTVAHQTSLTTKPIYVIWTAAPAEALDAREHLTGRRIPVFEDPVRCARAISMSLIHHEQCESRS